MDSSKEKIRRNPPSVAFGLPNWLHLVFGSLLAILLIGVYLVQSDPIPWVAYMGLAATTFAYITLTVNYYASDRQSRRQQTLTILYQSRYANETYSDMVEKYLAHIEGHERPVSIETIAQQSFGKDSLRPRASWILNYYEFIAVGCANRDLDYGLIHSNLRGSVCKIVVDMAHLIGERRGQPGDGTGKNPRIWEHLVWLYLHLEDEKKLPTYLHLLGPMPRKNKLTLNEKMLWRKHGGNE